MSETTHSTKDTGTDIIDVTTNFSDLFKSKTWTQQIDSSDASKYNLIFIRDKKENDFVVTNLNPHEDSFFETFSLPKELIQKPASKNMQKINLFTNISSIVCENLIKEAGLTEKFRFADIFPAINVNFYERIKNLCERSQVPSKIKRIIMGHELKSRQSEVVANMLHFKAPNDVIKRVNFNRVLNALFISSIRTETVKPSPFHELIGTGTSIVDLRNRLVNVYEAVPGAIYCFTYAVYDINDIVNTINIRNYWFDIDTVRQGYERYSKFYAIYQHEGLNNFMLNLLTIDLNISVDDMGSIFLNYQSPYVEGKQYVILSKRSDIDIITNNKIIPIASYSTADIYSLNRLFRGMTISYSMNDCIVNLYQELIKDKTGIKFTSIDRPLMLLALVYMNQDYGYSPRTTGAKNSVLLCHDISRLSVYNELIDGIEKGICQKFGITDLNDIDLSKYQFADKLPFVKST